MKKLIAKCFSLDRVNIVLTPACVIMFGVSWALTASDVEGAGNKLVVLALGDSLTAGYGLPEQHAFPKQLERALAEKDIFVKVINAGVSGDTSAGGLNRLEWALNDDPNVVIVELGANDALRGLDPAITYNNLDAIVKKLLDKGKKVLVAGMKAPPNLGKQYERHFNAIYPTLAEKYEIFLYPFFLDGVAGNPLLNQADGIHPNSKGVSTIVAGILPYVVRLIKMQ